MIDTYAECVHKLLEELHVLFTHGDVLLATLLCNYVRIKKYVTGFALTTGPSADGYVVSVVYVNIHISEYFFFVD